jgi:lipopolysaccharide heptosyltransferase I
MNKEINRVAIVRLSALGDIVNSVVVLQFLRAAHPDVTIEWITEEVFAPLVLLTKEIDKVHTVNIKKLKKEKSFELLKETISKLKNLGDFDLIIDMQGLIKSAIVSRLIGKNTHGFDKDSTRESLAAFFYKTSSHISYESGVVKRNCFLLSDALGFPINDEMLLNKKPVFEISKKYSFSKEKKNIAFVIGASWASKIYPKEQVVKVCNTLTESIHIIWGSEDERETAEWICERSEYATLAPQLKLTELVSFISSMDLLIGNDTGPTHLAWAQNIPSITLFGPTTTRMIYETPVNIGIKSPSKVNLLKIDKYDYSIQEIQAKLITHKAKELLYGL